MATVSDFMLKRLQEWGIRRIFGYPGDGINGIMDALLRAGNEVEFIQTRHEEMAAFMATGHAKFTREVGVCLATSGPGAIHLLNGLYDAYKDKQPVVAIIGQQKRMALGSDFQQEVDLRSLFKDVAHEYIQEVMVPLQMRTAVDRAMRIAVAERCVTCIVVPADVQELDMEEHPPRKHGAVETGVGYSRPNIVPAQSDLQQAANILNAGEKVAILVGAGAKEATTEIIAVANTLGAGVAKALLGKDVVPDSYPFVTGSIGLLGTKPSYELMMECDTLFMIGSSFPYSEFLPPEGQARGVQIDIQPRQLSLRYPMEINLVGDCLLTLQALLPLLHQKPNNSWQTRIRDKVAQWWQLMESRAMAPADPINPQLPFWELSKRLPDNAILAVDTGSSTEWYARDIKLREGMLASASGGLSTMGNGMPYALAAKFAYPERHVFALIGDGAAQMNGMNELITLAKYWRRWGNGKFTVLVLNNRDLNYVTWEQRAMTQMPRYAASQAIPDVPYAEYARLLGLNGVRVEKPEDVATALDMAIAADCPTVLDVFVDPNVPPLPPHISLEHAKSFAKAYWRGDEEALGVIMNAFRQQWAHFHDYGK